MCLYFFPAFLPLASLIPAILAAVGALSAGLQALRRKPKLALLFLTASALSLLLAAVIHHRHRTSPTAPLPEHRITETLPAQTTEGLWHQLVPRPPLSNLVWSERFNSLIYGTWEGTLDSVSLRDARLLFSLRLKEPVLTEPLLDGDRVFVGEGLHHSKFARLVAIRLPEGMPLWATLFESHLESQPRLTADRKSLLGCAGDAGLYSVDSHDGAIRWKKTIGHCDSTPWIEGQEIFALARESGDTSRLVALRISDGEESWNVTLPGEPWGTPVRDPATGLVILTTGRGQLDPAPQKNEAGWLHGVDPRSRKIVWSHPLSGMPLLTGSLFEQPDRGLAIHTLKKGEIQAWNTRDGSLVWKRPLKSPILAAPRLIPGTHRLAALSFDGTLSEVDAGTGALTAERKLGGHSFSAPAFSTTHAYFGDHEGLDGVPLTELGRRP